MRGCLNPHRHRRQWIAGRAALLAACLAFFCGAPARAHVGSPDVFFEGKAGPYSIRVIVRVPEVIPGLSDISVKVKNGKADSVSVLPIRWNTGKDGAPRPDAARRVKGGDDLYSAELWFMESGAHSVEVRVVGTLGEGVAQVPVNAVATRTLAMKTPMKAALLGMAVLLILLCASILGAALRESDLPPGVLPSRKRIVLGQLAVVTMACALAFLAYGGKRWWDDEERHYRSNRLFKAYQMNAAIERGSEGALLKLEIVDERFLRGSPLTPDHGKLMHAFVIRKDGLGFFAHLHPVRRGRAEFAAALPEMPPGRYRVYADITQETGFSTTCVSEFDAADSISKSDLAGRASDWMDDDNSWWRSPSNGVVPRVTDSESSFALNERLAMNWAGAEVSSLKAGEPLDLSFRVTNREGTPVRLQPYMGMFCHLVVSDAEGTVFVHLHPSGSVSMASMELFQMREEGTTPRTVANGQLDPICKLPPLEQLEARWSELYPLGEDRSVSTLYAFPKEGRYRVWTQVKAGGEVLTGAFDFEVTGGD